MSETRYSPKLVAGLRKIAEALLRRPPELRGPFVVNLRPREEWDETENQVGSQSPQ
jgi:hypothetical protein